MGWKWNVKEEIRWEMERKKRENWKENLTVKQFENLVWKLKIEER